MHEYNVGGRVQGPCLSKETIPFVKIFEGLLRKDYEKKTRGLA